MLDACYFEADYDLIVRSMFSSSLLSLLGCPTYGPCHTVPVLRARVFSFFCGPVRRKIWPVRQTIHVIRALLNTCFYNYELSHDLFLRSCLIDQLAGIYTTIALVISISKINVPIPVLSFFLMCLYSLEDRRLMKE